MDYKVTPNENWGVLNYLPIKFNLKVPSTELPLDGDLNIILPSSETVPVGTSLIFIINRTSEGLSSVYAEESAITDLINFSVFGPSLAVDPTVAYEAKLIEKGNWSVTRTAFIEDAV